MKISNYIKINSLLLLILVFIACNYINNTKVVSNEAIFGYSINKSGDYISEDISILELYSKFKKKCDDGNSDYTGNYYLLYDLSEERISFKEDNKLIAIELKGFVCPNSFNDIFYHEMNIFLSNGNLHINNYITHLDSIPKLVSRFILNSVNESFNYPYIIQLVVDDDVLVSQLSSLIASVVKGYLQFVEIYIKKVDSKAGNTKYPLRLKILPISKYNLNAPNKPPVD